MTLRVFLTSTAVVASILASAFAAGGSWWP